MPYMSSFLVDQRFIINLPKIRSVVADAGNPDGDDKLVLLRVQHEGASGEIACCSPFRLTILQMLELIHGQVL